MCQTENGVTFYTGKRGQAGWRDERIARAACVSVAVLGSLVSTVEKTVLWVATRDGYFPNAINSPSFLQLNFSYRTSCDERDQKKFRNI